MGSPQIFKKDGPRADTGISEARVGQLAEQERRLREQDIARGKQRGEELFTKQALGVREQKETAGDIKDIIGRRRAALEGLSSEEQTALRSQALQRIQRGQKTAERQLAGQQASAGIRGGLAGAQQQALISQAQGQRAQQEQDLFLQDLERRRQALGEFEGTIGSEQKRQQQKVAGQLATEFGFAQLGATERGGIRQQLIGEKQANAAAEERANSQGGKK